MSDPQRPFSSFRLPIMVLLIGLLSIVLLLWADLIRENLQLDENRVDAVKDIQIDIATYHLRLEEVESGAAAGGVQQSRAALAHALTAIGVILDGGTYGSDSVTKPLPAGDVRRRAEQIRSAIHNLDEIGRQRLATAKNSEVAGQLEATFEIQFRECIVKARGLESMLEKNEDENQAISVLLYRTISLCWSIVMIAAAAGLCSRERARRKVEEHLREANRMLSEQSAELLEHRQHLAEMVEQRTAELTVANAVIKAEAAERLLNCEALKDSERQIRELSSKLLQAQELERKRISMELHDELGQALNVAKLRLGLIKRGLPLDRLPEQQACRELLQYIDQIIENVRRLSRALSPTVLEDLGLTAALGWLVNSLNDLPELETKANIADIDHLFPKKQWITIYRIMQEAITNSHRHAGAERMSVSIGDCEGNVVFCVEDDGKGFDIAAALAKNAADKGLGLTTMTERIAMMGGNFDLWSEQGKGTRITFSIPSGKGAP